MVWYGMVHFWWDDDSNGFVVHSAEGQKRPQAGGCTLGRAIAHIALQFEHYLAHHRTLHTKEFLAV